MEKRPFRVVYPEGTSLGMSRIREAIFHNEPPPQRRLRAFLIFLADGKELARVECDAAGVSMMLIPEQVRELTESERQLPVARIVAQNQVEVPLPDGTTMKFRLDSKDFTLYPPRTIES